MDNGYRNLKDYLKELDLRKNSSSLMDRGYLYCSGEKNDGNFIEYCPLKRTCNRVSKDVDAMMNNPYIPVAIYDEENKTCKYYDPVEDNKKSNKTNDEPVIKGCPYPDKDCIECTLEGKDVCEEIIIEDVDLDAGTEEDDTSRLRFLKSQKIDKRKKKRVSGTYIGKKGYDALQG